MQQKMLSYGMPLIFGGMSLFFPAGLTLYISTNSILTLLHHLYMRAEDTKSSSGPARVAADEQGKSVARSAIDVEDESARGDGDAAAVEGKNGDRNAGKRRSRGRGGKRRGAHS